MAGAGVGGEMAGAAVGKTRALSGKDTFGLGLRAAAGICCTRQQERLAILTLRRRTAAVHTRTNELKRNVYM